MTMHHNNINKIVQTTLFIICIGLGSMLFVELRTDYSIAEKEPVLGAEDMELLSLPDASDEFPPITTYQEIVTRPLFTEDRQPYVYAGSESETNQSRVRKKLGSSAQQQYLLTAVIITPDQSTALIQSGKNKEVQHVIAGETIDDWTLTEVHPQHIVLKKDDKIQTIVLEVKKSTQQLKKRISQRSPDRTALKKATLAGRPKNTASPASEKVSKEQDKATVKQ